MAELPSGTVTFLFTDLEVSTRLWEEEADAMRVAFGAPRRDPPRGGRVVRRLRSQGPRRRCPRGVRDRCRCTGSGGRSPACARRRGLGRECTVARADGCTHRQRGAARRRLLRFFGESGGAVDGGRARRSGRLFASDRGPRGRRAAGRLLADRPGGASVAGLVATRAGLRGADAAHSDVVPTVAVAGGIPGEPAGAVDVVRGPRRRRRGGGEGTHRVAVGDVDRSGWCGQDAAGAPGRRGRLAAVRGRCVVV